MRSIKEQLESLRSAFRDLSRSKASKSSKKQKKKNKSKELINCPRCQAELNPKNLERHKRRVHGEKKRKKRGRKGSIFGRRNSESLSAEFKQGRDRLQRRGFDEGAKVPGWNYRKTRR